MSAFRVCICTTLITPDGTRYYQSPECTIHKSREADALTWEEIEAALKAAANAKAGHSQAS